MKQLISIITKRRLKLALCAFLAYLMMIPGYVLATASSADQLIALGMPYAVADFIGKKMVSVNTSGNLVLPVASGKKLSVTVAGTEAFSVNASGPTSASGMTITSGDFTLTSGNFIDATAAKGLILGEATRAANVTTATTLAAPFYDAISASTGDAAAFVGFGASTSGPVVDLFKTRAVTGAATTIVSSGDTIGTLKFWGANGTTYDPAAAIVVKSDATPGAATDMPGSIDFQTTPDGSVTLTSALKLNSAQKATFGGLAVIPSGVQYSASIMETVAAGTSSQGDGPLAAGKFIHLVTGFDETKVATLPACASGNIGEVHFILNNTTNKFAKIFPASGGTINSLSANAAYTQGVAGQGGKVLLCACQAANQWYCA